MAQSIGDRATHPASRPWYRHCCWALCRLLSEYFACGCADGHAGSFAVARPLATVIVKNRKRHRAVFRDIAGHGGFVAAGDAVNVERDNTALRRASLLATFLGRCRPQRLVFVALGVAPSRGL